MYLYEMEELDTLMKMSGISHTAMVYSGLVALVYLATDGFRKNAPFVFTLPVVALGFVTLNTRMPVHKKIFTALSFFLLASALYQWSMMPRNLEVNAALICASHFFYLISFIRCVKRWWKTLAVVTAFFTCIFFYTVFADLYRSLPIVVTVCGLTNVVIAVSFVAAGSVWKRGSNIAYAETAAFSRFIGIFLMLLCDVALLSDRFARHTKHLTWYLNLTYYLSQYMLYFSNYKAF